MQDGFYLIYCKDNQAFPVVMNNKEFLLLQSILPKIMKQPINVIDKSMGEVYNMNNKEKTNV